jgi:hypothetical protein
VVEDNKFPNSFIKSENPDWVVSLYQKPTFPSRGKTGKTHPTQLPIWELVKKTV